MIIMYSDDPRLIYISGTVVVACLLVGVEDSNDFIQVRIREPAVPSSDLLGWNPVSKNIRSLLE